MKHEVEKARLKYLLGDQYALLKESRAMLAGGCVTSLFTGADINDFDLYFKDKTGLSTQIAGMFSKEYGYFQLHHLTNKALMYIARDEDMPCQLIVFDFFKDAHDIFKRFDFTVNMAAYDFEKEEFVFHEDFWIDIAARRINVNVKTSYPFITTLRVDKYKQKGYSISKAQHLKLMLAVNSLEMKSWEDLRDQVGGMYGYSFDEIFNPEEGEDFSVEKAIGKIEQLSFIRERWYDKSQEFAGNSPSIPNLMEKWENILMKEQVEWYNSQKKELSSAWAGKNFYNEADDGGSEWLDSVSVTVEVNPFDKEKNENIV